MRTVTAFPHQVRVIENTFITVRDGTRLAARVWLPADAEDEPVPAVFEYIPYRKRDITRGRDALLHPYVAGHGYASVRVDLRGSGDSDGVIVDEYRPAELEDAEDVIAWLAAQPWCDGNVGMFGVSWGGFNSLQVAARRPPALGAIISACASDDLYVDNFHHMGGCLLSDNLSEATVMFAFNSLPPDPAIVGDRWRQMWHERLEGSGLWLETWLGHQRRDAYWQPASVSEDHGAIACPVLAVGGWADGYTNAIFRLLEHLDVPRKGVIGPWGHRYPHTGVPGPAIGFLQEVVRWWDHWLKGIDRGVDDDPTLRVFLQDSVPSRTSKDDRPGRWVAEPSWPIAGTHTRTYHLAPHRLSELEPPASEHADLQLSSPLSVGSFAGKWASYAAPFDLPDDQREEDGGALVFDSPPLSEPLEILGLPAVELDVAADRPVAMVAVRLSDVRPDGQVTRITYGLLNLTHRDSSEHPEPLEPGRRYRVEVRLNGIAQRFPAGHRLRLSISSSYWPLAWPSPEPVTLTVATERSLLHLPVRPPRAEDAELRPFGPPEVAPELSITRLTPSEHHRRLLRDLVTDESTLEVVGDEGAVRIDETGTVVARATDERYRSVGYDLTSVQGETATEWRLARDDWGVRVTTRTSLTSTAADFVVHAELEAYEQDASGAPVSVFSRSWQRTIPRDLV